MTKTAAEAVAEAGAWLEENPLTGSKRSWLEKLVDSGWAAPSWPEEWFGRGLEPEVARATDVVFREARFEDSGEPDTGPDGFSIWR